MGGVRPYAGHVPAVHACGAAPPLELIEAARTLAESGGPPPTQARLRRAVSTAYYAMFHCLAASAADLFIGTEGTERSPAWHRAYRALEHGRARSACRQGSAMREFPAEIRDFAEAFVGLQRTRQEAAGGGLRTGHGRLPEVRRSGPHRFRGARHPPVRAGRRHGQARFRCPCAVQAAVTAGGST